MNNSNELNHHKKEVAAKVYEILKPFAKNTFFFGGFSARLNGSKRNINDIDIFLNFDHPEISFIDDNIGFRIMNAMDAKLKRAFGSKYQGLELVDDCTLTTHCDGVEIDIACRPLLFKNRDIEKYPVVMINDTKVRIETPLDCALTKGLAFVFRDTQKKRITDLFDIISLISKNKQPENWLDCLSKNKQQAYTLRIDTLKKSGKPVFKKTSLSAEFNSCVKELVKELKQPSTLNNIRDIFGKENEKAVIDLITEFSSKINKSLSQQRALCLN